MKYTVEKEELYTIFTLLEENVNSTVAPTMKSDFIFWNQEGVRNLIMDMNHVKFVDSSGLSAILTAHRLWKGRGEFIMAGEMAPMVDRLIKISKLDSVLTIVPTVSEAIDYVMMAQVENELLGEED